jgi:hypothetical protein
VVVIGFDVFFNKLLEIGNDLSVRPHLVIQVQLPVGLLVVVFPKVGIQHRPDPGRIDTAVVQVRAQVAKANGSRDHEGQKKKAGKSLLTTNNSKKGSTQVMRYLHPHAHRPCPDSTA